MCRLRLPLITWRADAGARCVYLILKFCGFDGSEVRQLVPAHGQLTGRYTRRTGRCHMRHCDAIACQHGRFVPIKRAIHDVSEGARRLGHRQGAEWIGHTENMILRIMCFKRARTHRPRRAQFPSGSSSASIFPPASRTRSVSQRLNTAQPQIVVHAPITPPSLTMLSLVNRSRPQSKFTSRSGRAVERPSRARCRAARPLANVERRGQIRPRAPSARRTTTTR